ncbi:hypothetical protein Tco_0702698 [Tanacetum coccineum]|uniref:Uncharacterized protein n=1 Tax=Tanacetum coccineum TaxID=301880 RepID=A0ABQ4XXJ8_9ASTR
MGEINECIPIKVNGHIYHVRISKDHNRSILLNNLDDLEKGSLEEDLLFSNEDDDSDGISETEVARNSEEASFENDHRGVVKKDEFDSSSHVSPTYEETTKEASECNSNCNDDLNSNLNQYTENDITNDNLEAQQDEKAHLVINHGKGKAQSSQPSLAHLKNHTTNFVDGKLSFHLMSDGIKKTGKSKLKKNNEKASVFGKSLFAQDLQLRSESSFSRPTNEIKDENRRALGLVCDEVHEEVAKEQVSSF